MVKSICYTLAAILLCLGIFIYAEIFLNRQFEEFSKALYQGRKPHRHSRGRVRRAHNVERQKVKASNFGAAQRHFLRRLLD